MNEVKGLTPKEAATETYSVSESEAAKAPEAETKDPGTKARDLLAKRRTRLRRRLWTLVGMLVGGLLATVLAAVYYAMTVWESRIIQDEILYGTCAVTLGEQTITGRRMFIRPYTEVAGIRFINPAQVAEQVIIDNVYPGLIIVSLVGDQSDVVIMGDDLSPTEIPVGDRYLFVLGADSTIITHVAMCN